MYFIISYDIYKMKSERWKRLRSEIVYGLFLSKADSAML